MIRRITASLAAALVVTFFTSCKDEGRGTPEFKESYIEEVAENLDVVGTVRAEDELSEFAEALNETIEMTVQFETGTYTVFAPNNEAFSLAELDPENDPARFSEVVEYHIVEENLVLEDLKQKLKLDEGPYTLVTLTGDEILVTLEGDRIALTDELGNSAYILRSIDAINGRVHIIDNTLMPEQRQEN